MGFKRLFSVWRITSLYQLLDSGKAEKKWLVQSCVCGLEYRITHSAGISTEDLSYEKQSNVCLRCCRPSKMRFKRAEGVSILRECEDGKHVRPDSPTPPNGMTLTRK